MQPIIMQDWVTIRGISNGTVIQSQANWILTAPFQDITFYLDVREFTGATPTIQYETGPGRDDPLFVKMGTAVTIAVGFVTTTYYANNASVPVSHWTRWKLNGPAVTPWDVSFRIMASGNSIC